MAAKTLQRRRTQQHLIDYLNKKKRRGPQYMREWFERIEGYVVEGRWEHALAAYEVADTADREELPDWAWGMLRKMCAARKYIRRIAEHPEPVVQPPKSPRDEAGLPKREKKEDRTFLRSRDEKLVDRATFVAYLQQCANEWEGIAKQYPNSPQLPDPAMMKQGAVVRQRARKIEQEGIRLGFLKKRGK
jgi:hypothetical protein